MCYLTKEYIYITDSWRRVKLPEFMSLKIFVTVIVTIAIKAFFIVFWVLAIMKNYQYKGKGGRELLFLWKQKTEWITEPRQTDKHTLIDR